MTGVRTAISFLTLTLGLGILAPAEPATSSAAPTHASAALASASPVPSTGTPVARSMSARRVQRVSAPCASRNIGSSRCDTPTIMIERPADDRDVEVRRQHAHASRPR